MQKFGIASDHGGFSLKQEILTRMQHHSLGVTDFGPLYYDGEDDFPDYVFPLAEAIKKGDIDKGIAICGSGVGACIAANKVYSVKAALVTEPYSAHQGVEHDNMNLICLGGRVTGPELAWEIVMPFINAEYQGAERQLRRMRKIEDYEKQHFS